MSSSHSDPPMCLARKKATHRPVPKTITSINCLITTLLLLLANGRPIGVDLFNRKRLSTLVSMIAWFRSFLKIAPHLKVSTLTGQPVYYAYMNEGWQAIPKARFDQLLSSGHFYQHEAASSTHELIYNYQMTKRS